jgi:transcriptional regulator with XRE-family HTH domain
MKREMFSEYVDRVMKQKDLKGGDVERNSGDKIDRSHVSKFVTGAETNPSANAMLALAAGLKVNPHEVFTAVTGASPDEDGANAPDVLEIISLIEKVASDTELLEMVRGLIRLSKEGRATFSKTLDFCYEQNQPVKRRGRRDKKGRQS